jgi:hypothetical protein
MPYSLAALKSNLKSSLQINIQCLDLNAYFHTLQFPKYYATLQSAYQNGLTAYGQLLQDFENESRELYAENHKLIVHKQLPLHLQTLIQHILNQKPDFIAFSLVYNSQCFYTESLINELQHNSTTSSIPIITGGPAVTTNIKKKTIYLKNEHELITYFQTQNIQPTPKSTTIIPPDFSDFNTQHYLSAKPIYPLKSSTTCFYKLCTFCTHFAHVPYAEYPIESIVQTIKNHNIKYIYFIDDMISTKHLLELAKALKPLDVKWWVQLRPTKDLIPALPTLAQAGLHTICWGIESANQRILDLMKKGTHLEDIPNILQTAHNANIKNMVYIMFGFPTETKQEVMHSFDFLTENKHNIDLICSSIFGLQHGSAIYDNPEQYNITNINEKQRTVLDPKITYTITSGLTTEQTKKIRHRHMHRIISINKFPKVFDYVKEQMLLF